jgi:hypothetical protein
MRDEELRRIIDEADAEIRARQPEPEPHYLRPVQASLLDPAEELASESDGGEWKPVRERGNVIEHPDPYCGHMKRGVRKPDCPRCMRAAYPGVPFEEAQRLYIAANGVKTSEGGR